MAMEYCCKWLQDWIAIFAPDYQLFQIVSSIKHRGKWISPNDFSTALDAPNGRMFGPYRAIYVCSAGRENLTTGTQAEITIQPLSSNERIILKWNVPASGDASHSLKYNQSKYQIEEDYVHTNFYEYFIRTK